jgi:hypothetical protein
VKGALYDLLGEVASFALMSKPEVTSAEIKEAMNSFLL